MAMPPAERKRLQRKREAFLDMKTFRMELAANERKAIEEAATARGFEDQTEYVMALVYKDRDASRIENVCSYPECNCPFDMGPDGLCLVGKPRKDEAEEL